MRTIGPVLERHDVSHATGADPILSRLRVQVQLVPACVDDATCCVVLPPRMFWPKQWNQQAHPQQAHICGGLAHPGSLHTRQLCHSM